MAETKDETIKGLKEVLKYAQEHLKIYRAYEARMGATGNGCSIYHKFNPEYLNSIIEKELS